MKCIVSPSIRIAVYGGDQRQCAHWGLSADEIIFFQSTRSGGNGELRRLTDAIRGGGLQKVFILSRFNGHSATRSVRKLCRRVQIPCLIIP